MIHAAHDRAFKGFRTKSLDEHNVCLEYTDCFPTRKEAIKSFRQNRSILSRGCKKIITVKVFGRQSLLNGYKQYKRALIELVEIYKYPEEIHEATGMALFRCKEIWKLAGRT